MGRSETCPYVTIWRDTGMPGCGNKPAKLETGLETKAPLFIAKGDVVRLDTRSGGYLERVG